MSRMMAFVVGVTLVAVIATSVAVPVLAQAGQAQPPAGQRQVGPAGQRFQMTPEQMRQMLGQMLDQLGLTASEKKVALQATEAKYKAQAALREQLRTLGETVRGQVTDAQAQAALNRYRQAQKDYERKAGELDQGLVKKLSPHSQARLVAVGIIDNGLGMRLGRGTGMGMGAGRGIRPGSGQ